jgi:hypothetical protein
MKPDNAALFASVILIVPMFYFLLASPAFLLVRLDTLPVARLLRGMFNGYLLILSIAGAIGTIAVAVNGRLALAMGIGLFAAFAALSRRWYLQRMDFPSDVDPVDVDVVQRLRRLYWGGMLSNAIQLAVVISCIPHIAVIPA